MKGLIALLALGKWKTREAGTETETEIRKKIVRSKSIYVRLPTSYQVLY